MKDIFDELDEPVEHVFEDKTHWFNSQKKWLKKREFWRAVIYALTRPDDYKPILLEKAEKEKELCETMLAEIKNYGEDVGFVRPNRITKGE